MLYVQPTLAAEPRVLIDPNTLAKDGTVALTASAVSHDGQWLAYGTAAAGSDWNEFRVRSVATGQDIDDLVRWVKFSNLSWSHDSRGFFYSRYDQPKGEAGSGQTFSALAHQKLYYHRLGTPQSADRLIYEISEQPQWLVSGLVTEDGRFLIITIERGDSNFNLLRFVDLGDSAAPRLDAPIGKLIETWNAEYVVVGNDGPVLLVQTNLGAPRKRIIAIDTRAPQPDNWKVIVPEGPDVIDLSGVVGGRLVILMMHDAANRLRVFT